MRKRCILSKKSYLTYGQSCVVMMQMESDKAVKGQINAKKHAA